MFVYQMIIQSPSNCCYLIVRDVYLDHYHVSFWFGLTQINGIIIEHIVPMFLMGLELALRYEWSSFIISTIPSALVTKKNFRISKPRTCRVISGNFSIFIIKQLLSVQIENINPKMNMNRFFRFKIYSDDETNTKSGQSWTLFTNRQNITTIAS